MTAKLTDPQVRVLRAIRDTGNSYIPGSNGGGVHQVMVALTAKGFVDGPRTLTAAGEEALAAHEDALAAAQAEVDAEWRAFYAANPEANLSLNQRLINRLKAMGVPGAATEGVKIVRVRDEDGSRPGGNWWWRIEPLATLGSRRGVRPLMGCPRLMVSWSDETRDWTVAPYDGSEPRDGLIIEAPREDGR